MRRLLPFFLVLAAFPAFANLDLTLKVDATPYKGKSIGTPVSAPDPATHTTTHLLLGPNFHRYEDAGQVTIVDFATRRVYVTDSKGTAELSLFANAGGTIAEMENRIALDEIAKAAKTTILPLVVSEHELSMRSGKAADRVERSEKNGRIFFRAGELALADFSKETIATTDAERDAFVRFVRHTFHAHPDILDELRKQKGIPRTLNIVQHTSRRAWLITVTDVKQSADAPYVTPANPHLDIESDKTLGPIASKALHGIAFDAKAKANTEIAALLSAEKYLDAFLAILEYNLTAGEVLPAMQDERLKNDPNVRAFASSLRAKTAEEARATLAVLARLHSVATDKSYVLSIFEADMHANLREPEEAHAKFIEVLTKNPYITGVWKDLGDVFARTYASTTAWDCWTIARRLNPTLPLLKQINDQEAALLRDHPDFF